jgi:HSP20 family molecular chaperone IbpA
LVFFIQSISEFQFPKNSEHEIKGREMKWLSEIKKTKHMSFLALRKPHKSHFDNFFEDEFFTSRSLFQPPRFALQRNDPFEDFFSDKFFKNEQFNFPRENEDFEFEMKISKRIPKENVNVRIVNGTLKVDASFKNGNSFESYSQQVTIPKGVDVERISAKLNHGKLSISIPRVENNLIKDVKDVNVKDVEKEEEEMVIEEEPLTENQEEEPLLQVPKDEEIYE